MEIQIAPQKTEIVILEGRRTLKEIEVKVENMMIKSSPSVRYLGVHLDKDVRMVNHIIKTTEKAEAVLTSLSRIMNKTAGPSHSKRRTIATVVQSIVLYGAPAWERALKIQ